MALLLTTLAGLLGGTLFVLDESPSVRIGMAAMVATFVWAMWRIAPNRIALFSRFMVLLYCLPFTSMTFKAVDPDFEWWHTPAASRLISEDLLMRDMVMTGLVGLFGLLAGILVVSIRQRRAPDSLPPPAAGSTLNPFMFAFVLALALAASAASAGDKTIFEATYETDALVAATSGGILASAYMLSYIFITMLFIDTQSETVATVRRAKLIALACAVGFVVIFHQLLQGNREVIGLLAALAAMYVTQPSSTSRKEQTKIEWGRIRRLTAPATAVVFIFLAIGQLRYIAEEPGVADQGVAGAAMAELSRGATWTAVLLGNLGLANEYRTGKMIYRHGETYVDYARSLPPRIIAEPLGIERKMKTSEAPGLWYYPLQPGGVHPSVVPFKNFGIFGVFGVLLLYGMFIAWVDGLPRTSPSWSLLIGSVFAGSFNWFWYGDIPFIRTLNEFVIAWALYWLIERFGNRARTASPPARLKPAEP